MQISLWNHSPPKNYWINVKPVTFKAVPSHTNFSIHASSWLVHCGQFPENMWTQCFGGKGEPSPPTSAMISENKFCNERSEVFWMFWRIQNFTASPEVRIRWRQPSTRKWDLTFLNLTAKTLGKCGSSVKLKVISCFTLSSISTIFVSSSQFEQSVPYLRNILKFCNTSCVRSKFYKYTFPFIERSIGQWKTSRGIWWKVQWSKSPVPLYCIKIICMEN